MSYQNRERILRNSAHCLNCGDEIESKSVHDFVWCKCHNIAVDGGKEYLKRCGYLESYEDTSIVVPEEPFYVTSTELADLQLACYDRIDKTKNRKGQETVRKRMEELIKRLYNVQQIMATRRGLKI